MYGCTGRARERRTSLYWKTLGDVRTMAKAPSEGLSALAFQQEPMAKERSLPEPLRR